MHNTSMNSASWRWVAVAGLAFCLAGCSNYGKHWKAAKKLEPTADNPLAGAWKGGWDSEKGWHDGGLRMTMEPVREHWYRARVDASYWLLFHSQYQVLINAIPQGDGTYVFTGEKDLGWNRGGIYEMEGLADADDMRVEYRSDSDHGKFLLHKATPTPRKQQEHSGAK